MRPTDDPFRLSPSRRFHEVARIFAVGVLRQRKLRLLASESVETSRESAGEYAGRLEVSGETVLSVTTG